MQNNGVMYNARKTNGLCNNRNLKCFVRNQLSHLASVRIGYNTSITSRHSQEYINYRCKKNQPYCYCLYLHVSFIYYLHKAIVHGSVFVPLSNKG